ncbi:MAG: hypothetical protein M1837_002036 [Sclerophora amabilis]|nr:MAG: hypothetical protein M1837_002036 [Sclerophora amabilis]
MAPRKEKSEKPSTDKAAATKTLKEMHERGEIEGKSAGKQQVYHAVQTLTSRKDPNDAANPEELSAMDAEINALREEIATAKAEQKALSSTLICMKSTVTTGDLRESVKELERSKREILERLMPFRTGDVAPVSAKERATISEACKAAERSAARRKKIFKEFWGLLCENLEEGSSKEDLWVGDERHSRNEGSKRPPQQILTLCKWRLLIPPQERLGLEDDP